MFGTPEGRKPFLFGVDKDWNGIDFVLVKKSKYNEMYEKKKFAGRVTDAFSKDLGCRTLLSYTPDTGAALLVEGRHFAVVPDSDFEILKEAIQ